MPLDLIPNVAVSFEIDDWMPFFCCLALDYDLSEGVTFSDTFYFSFSLDLYSFFYDT